MDAFTGKYETRGGKGMSEYEHEDDEDGVIVAIRFYPPYAICSESVRRTVRADK